MSKDVYLQIRISPEEKAQFAGYVGSRGGDMSKTARLAIAEFMQRNPLRKDMTMETRQPVLNAHLDAASARVNNSPALEAYRDLLVGYDWPNLDEHLEWVRSATEEELVDWAESIRKDQAND